MVSPVPYISSSLSSPEEGGATMRLEGGPNPSFLLLLKTGIKVLFGLFI